MKPIRELSTLEGRLTAHRLIASYTQYINNRPEWKPGTPDYVKQLELEIFNTQYWDELKKTAIT